MCAIYNFFIKSGIELNLFSTSIAKKLIQNRIQKLNELPLELHHMSVMIANPQNITAWYSCYGFKEKDLWSARLTMHRLTNSQMTTVLHWAASNNHWSDIAAYLTIWTRKDCAHKGPMETIKWEVIKSTNQHISARLWCQHYRWVITHVAQGLFGVDKPT